MSSLLARLLVKNTFLTVEDEKSPGCLRRVCTAPEDGKAKDSQEAGLLTRFVPFLFRRSEATSGKDHNQIHDCLKEVNHVDVNESCLCQQDAQQFVLDADEHSIVSETTSKLDLDALEVGPKKMEPELCSNTSSNEYADCCLQDRPPSPASLRESKQDGRVVDICGTGVVDPSIRPLLFQKNTFIDIDDGSREDATGLRRVRTDPRDARIKSHCAPTDSSTLPSSEADAESVTGHMSHGQPCGEWSLVHRWEPDQKKIDPQRSREQRASSEAFCLNLPGMQGCGMCCELVFRAVSEEDPNKSNRFRFVPGRALMLRLARQQNEESDATYNERVSQAHSNCIAMDVQFRVQDVSSGLPPLDSDVVSYLLGGDEVNDAYYIDGFQGRHLIVEAWVRNATL
jgi:hypothetical protein